MLNTLKGAEFPCAQSLRVSCYSRDVSRARSLLLARCSRQPKTA